MARAMLEGCCFRILFIIVLASFTRLSWGDSAGILPQKIDLGAIVNLASRSGKEGSVAMEMAIQDFHGNIINSPTLHIKNSLGEPMRAASSGMEFLLLTARTLIGKDHVAAIVGFGTSQEAVFVADLINKSEVPVLSLANEVPPWACLHWPFLINAARSQSAQMKAVADIIQSWQWQKVNIIYEDVNAAVTGIIPYLVSALQDTGSEISNLLPLPPLTSYYPLSEKLEHLKNGQCRVQIVHASARLAADIFMEAKNLGMMEKGFVWIMTGAITNFIDTFNSSVIASMQGVLGVKSYFPHSSKQFGKFRTKFCSKFRSKFPNESYPEPGIYAVQAYDAMWALNLALMEGIPAQRIFRNSINNSHRISVSGQKLLTRILDNNFEGLAGAFNYRKGMLPPARIFSIINVVGKSYRELGYWTENLGFSEGISNMGSKYNRSMRILGQVYWPGGPWSVPRGWAIPTSAKPLNIGVPTENAHKQFVDVAYDKQTGELKVKGFSVDVFNAALNFLPYHLKCNFVAFNGTYDSLVQQIHLQNFDAVVADTAILSNRCKYAEFSQPYADSGLQMVVYAKSSRLNKVWLFTKPFTKTMWILTMIITVYNGFIVWLIELRENPESNERTIWKQIGNMVSSAFITLFSLKGDGLKSNYAKLAMAAWLLFALVFTQSFTASLTSLLTAQRLETEIVDVETLRISGAKVGCDVNSFVVEYLEVVLQFHRDKIVQIYSDDDYAEALRSGEIAAAFLEVPYVKVFLAKNCKNFTTSGPTFKVGGFGFVFPRSSPYLPDISEAVLKVAEKGILNNLESSLTSSYKCLASDGDDDDDDREILGLSSFWGLFAITFVTSTLAALLKYAPFVCQYVNRPIKQEHQQDLSQHQQDVQDLPQHQHEVQHQYQQELQEIQQDEQEPQQEDQQELPHIQQHQEERQQS